MDGRMEASGNGPSGLEGGWGATKNAMLTPTCPVRPALDDVAWHVPGRCEGAAAGTSRHALRYLMASPETGRAPAPAVAGQGSGGHRAGDWRAPRQAAPPEQAPDPQSPSIASTGQTGGRSLPAHPPARALDGGGWLAARATSSRPIRPHSLRPHRRPCEEQAVKLLFAAKMRPRRNQVAIVSTSRCGAVRCDAGGSWTKQTGDQLVSRRPASGEGQRPAPRAFGERERASA
ncbi:hypothetical protein PCL_12601 [Purpureocillium lilacinum]|uniref:Uncharacterized protein n=1 Tax=Purpureocillium lilacinum TaxID=33203 RepID=A0A2U3E9R3_PURLI|nr:hypothetical protein Purlil1_8721 [Purpureocillium lilacinum]PWI71233.1 hypothetical protein PCL_12601 [Purpureocillium lilacinum]